MIEFQRKNRGPQGIQGIQGLIGPNGTQGPPGPTNISSNVYPRSEIVNLTNSQEHLFPAMKEITF